jgi:hypothetical protein
MYHTCWQLPIKIESEVVDKKLHKLEPSKTLRHSYIFYLFHEKRRKKHNIHSYFSVGSSSHVSCISKESTASKSAPTNNARHYFLYNH